ncbi:MAG TPA: SCO family protein [Chloroflexota bacterium]|nr:SCO family protein [Chloroflexota bacterium]
MAAAVKSPARVPQRLPMILFAAGCVALLFALFAAGMLWWQSSRALVGTDLQGVSAPGFSLVDQDGQQISLAQFQGKPVALTFLYTHCLDACPLIADEMRQASDRLGSDAGKVAMLAVSTDPRHDDRVSVVNFTQVHGMAGRWHYLMGSPEQLSPIWKAYYIGVTPGDQMGSALGENEVIHSEAVYLIDKTGHERALLGLPFSAGDLANDLRKLLSE